MFIGKEFESSNAFIAYPFTEASYGSLNFDGIADTRLPANALLDFVAVLDADFCAPVYLQSLRYIAAKKFIHMSIGCTPAIIEALSFCDVDTGLNGGFGYNPSRPTTSCVTRIDSTGAVDTGYAAELVPAKSFPPKPYNLYGVAWQLMQTDDGVVARGYIGTAAGAPLAGLVRFDADGTIDAGFDVPPEYGSVTSMYSMWMPYVGKPSVYVSGLGVVMAAHRSWPVFAGVVVADSGAASTIGVFDDPDGLPLWGPGYTTTQGYRCLDAVVTCDGQLYADIYVPFKYVSRNRILEFYPAVRIPHDLSPPDLSLLTPVPVPAGRKLTEQRGQGAPALLAHPYSFGDTESWDVRVQTSLLRYAAEEYSDNQLQLDTTFTNPAGLEFTDIATLSGGSIMAFGTRDTTVYTRQPLDEYGEYGEYGEYDVDTIRMLVKLQPNGALDTSFMLDPRAVDYAIGVDALTDKVDHVTAVAEQADGKLLVALAGTNYNCHNAVLLRVSASGALDESFTPFEPLPSSRIFPTIYDILIQPDGSIIVAGGFQPEGATVLQHEGELLTFKLSDSGREMYTTPDSATSARAVVTAALTDYLEGVGGAKDFTAAEPLVFDESTTDRRAARVESLAVAAAIPTASGLTGDPELLAGHNVSLRYDAIANGVIISSAAGEGTGRVPCTGFTTVDADGLATVLGAGDHNLEITGDDCYEITPTAADTLTISGGCDACCDCEDYLEILDEIARIRETNAALAARIAGVVAAYHAEIGPGRQTLNILPRNRALSNYQPTVEP